MHCFLLFTVNSTGSECMKLYALDQEDQKNSIVRVDHFRFYLHAFLVVGGGEEGKKSAFPLTPGEQIPTVSTAAFEVFSA